MKTSLCAVLMTLGAGAYAQIEIDKPIQMTGASSPERLISNVADPVSPQDAATKAYVDANSGGGGHYLGEVFGGGVIYSLSQDGSGNETGLIVCPADQSSGRTWSATNSVIVGTNNYNGLANSTAINAQNSNSAAGDCLASTHGGYTDWYLPSFFELRELSLNHLYASRGLGSMGGTQLQMDYPYWSSSEWSPWEPASMALNINFGSLSMNPETKDTATRWVRCIRAF
jgi:hypothetical protein